MKYTPYKTEKKTIEQHFIEAQDRGVMLVVTSNSGRKGLLIQDTNMNGHYRVMYKDGSFSAYTYGDEPFNRWKLIGEINFSTELD